MLSAGRYERDAFLVLLAGDGIREGVQWITELVNRSATKAFTLGLIGVAVYKLGKKRFAIQPRVLAQTEVVTRHMTIVNMKGETETVIVEDVNNKSTIKGRKH